MIDDAADLLAFAKDIADGKGESYNGKIVSIQADIDLNPNWDAESNDVPEVKWPVFNDKGFAGTIEGNGHTISGLYLACDGGSENKKASHSFFGCVYQDRTANVQNLAITNSKIVMPYLINETGKNIFAKVGGVFAGVMGNANLNNLYIDIDIVPTTSTAVTGNEDVCCVGGIVGWARNHNGGGNNKVDFTDCVVVSDINPGDHIWGIGGLIGRSENRVVVEMTDCAFYGTISGNHSIGGFIARMNSGNYTLRRCVFAGEITGNNQTGGLVNSIQANHTPVLELYDCISVEGYAKPSGVTTGFRTVALVDLIAVPENYPTTTWRSPATNALIMPTSLGEPIVLDVESMEDPWEDIGGIEDNGPSTRVDDDDVTTKAPTTEAPTTEAPATTTEEEKSGGCGATVGVVSLMMICALGVAAVSKKED